MKVVVDDKIPYIKEAVEQIADCVVFAPGKEFNRALVKDADALIIRTRTHCNRELLEGTQVKFIATATIGYDHIDTGYCKEAGIVWTNAPGCNSSSVAQYMESCLILLQKYRNLPLNRSTIGIVGVGNVGSKIAVLARKYGMNVLLNDLPRADKEGGEAFTSLDKIAEECDIITFHTPLYKEGIYKTYHLANRSFFELLRKKPVIINTSRGEVIDTGALLKALSEGVVSDAIIDVWENEPDIDSNLLDHSFIATPHIAGYSADGKANATRMSLDALCSHFGIAPRYRIEPPAPRETLIIAPSLEEALLKIYNPLTDSDLLKKSPQLFEYFRGNYPLRREKEAYCFGIESEWV